MKEIALKNGKLALVDDCDFSYLSKFKWYEQKCRKGSYAIRNAYIDGKRTTISMHRDLFGSSCEGKVVDHVSHQTLDNRRANLRVCSRKENSRNQLPYQNVTSPFKGVSWCKTNKKWSAQINTGGKTYHLGRFESEVCAAKAYDKAAKEMFGEFAYVNSYE